MKNTLICIGFCLCAGALTVTSAAWAKKNSNCKDADVVLSKKFPHFSFDLENYGCAHNDAGECDPDFQDIPDDGNGLVINGTNRNNIIHGSSGPDTICGGNGKDKIWGEAGDDTIYGDNGKDSLYGGPGDDKLYGDNGKDSLYGGLGDDELYGGNGKDHLSGYDDTNDDLTGPFVDDNSDDDILSGENGKDKLTGGPGDDVLRGGKGKDYLDGGDGDDDIMGDKGKDNCVDNDDDFFTDDVDENECAESDLEDSKKKNKSP